MSRPYEQILHEVSTATEFLQSGGVALDSVRGDLDFYIALADLPDDTIIHNFAPELPDLGPSSISVETVEEFELVYQALGVVHRFPVDRHKIDFEIDHEKDHLASSRQIGFRALRYGITITDSYPLRSFSWRPYHAFAEPIGQVTKLAIGSIVAAPRHLSEGDTLRLNSMRYQGRHDVAQRIAKSNNPLTSVLRLPAGYTQADI